MLSVVPIERRSLSDAVFDQLRQRIVGGAFGPGTTLPAERKLCELLGVNRGALREALKRLQQAGLVTVQHGGQTKVVNYRESAGLDLLPSLLLTADGAVNTEVARGVIELRTAIAEDAARLCATRADAATRRAIGELVEEMKAAGSDLGERHRLSMAFWKQIILGSGNVAYRLAHNTLMRTWEQIGGLLTQVLAPELSNLAGFRGVAKAVQAKDAAAAAKAARKLLDQGSVELFKLLDELERSGGKP
mgnify:CR=1 FL=1